MATLPNSAIGSTAPEGVVPMVAHKNNGTKPDLISSSMAKRRFSGDNENPVEKDVSINRKFDGGMPTSFAAFWKVKCV